MKFVLFLLFVLYLPTITYSQANLSFDVKKSEVEVWDFVQKWNHSFVKNDPLSYFKSIHKDLTLFVASSPYRIEGKYHDQEEFEWSLKKGNTRVSLFQELQPKVQMLSENSALVTYHNRGAYGSVGAEQIVYLKETNVLVKVNGAWQIIHIHVSK